MKMKLYQNSVKCKIKTQFFCPHIHMLMVLEMKYLRGDYVMMVEPS